MYRHKDVPRYDRIHGFEFLLEWFLLAWDTLVDQVGLQKAEDSLRLYNVMSSRAVALNLREWGVIDGGLESVLQTMAFTGQHTTSGGYELQRSGDVGFVRKRSCLAAYSRHRICHMRCDEILNMMCSELLPTHSTRLLGTIYDGNPACLFMIAPKDSKTTPQEMANLEKTVLDPVPISEAFREKLVSNYLYEWWLIMIRGLRDSIGIEKTEQLLTPSMRQLGIDYSEELSPDSKRFGINDPSIALASLIFTRLNSDVRSSGSSDNVEVASCPFIGQDRSICRLVHSFISGLVGDQAAMSIYEPELDVLQKGPCFIRVH